MGPRDWRGRLMSSRDRRRARYPARACGARPMVTARMAATRARGISANPLPTRAKTTAKAQSMAMPCSANPISFDCEWRRNMPRRLPGIGWQKLSSAVEVPAPTANTSATAAMRQDVLARPASGSARITDTGSATALSFDRSTAARATGAEAMSSGASSPETVIQAIDPRPDPRSPQWWGPVQTRSAPDDFA